MRERERERERKTGEKWRETEGGKWEGLTDRQRGKSS